MLSLASCITLAQEKPGATPVEQTTCDDQARMRFQQDGYDRERKNPDGTVSMAGIYTVIPKPQTQACYIWVTFNTKTNAGALLLNYRVYDAFKGHMLGELTIVLFHGGLPLRPTGGHLQCRVMPPGR